MVQFWKSWCRLCARENSCDSHLDMFIVGSQEQELISTINRVFNVDMNIFENFPKMLCTDCYYHIKTTINLTKRVSKATAMFTELLSKNEQEVNVQQIKTIHNLDADFIILTPKNFFDVIKTEREVLAESMIEPVEVHCSPIENSNPISIEKEEQEDDFEYKPNINEIDDDSTDDSPATENTREKCTPKKRGKYKSKNERMEENKAKPYYCSECHKGFLKLHNYRRHMQDEHSIEIDVKPQQFICEICNKEHKTISALKEHEQSHTEERTLKCKYCEKAFKGVRTLKLHEDTHSETNYICVVCGLKLNTQSTLRMHMLVHSDQKRHKCDFCGNEYKRAKTLKAHLILHSGLRPYSCGFCDKTFTNGANCRSHQKKSHSKALALQEAAGKKRVSTAVIPKLKELKAMAPESVVSPSSVKNSKARSKNLDAENSSSKEEPDLFQNLFLPTWNYKNNV